MNHTASKGKKNVDVVASTKNEQQLLAPHVVRVAGVVALDHISQRMCLYPLIPVSFEEKKNYIADVYLRNNSLSDLMGMM